MTRAEVDGHRTESIRRAEAARAAHVARGPLFAEYVAYYDALLARLRAGLPLTPYQRGEGGSA